MFDELGNMKEPEGAINASFGESPFHNMALADDDGLKDDYECPDLGMISRGILIVGLIDRLKARFRNVSNK